jgi:hypothetical protein
MNLWLELEHDSRPLNTSWKRYPARQHHITQEAHEPE